MTTPTSKEKVLIICNHNSVRSRIAEGLLKSLYGNYYEVHSAGNEPTIVDPYAINVLAEIGIDISENRSKSLKKFDGLKFDYVVTVCGGDGQACPFFKGGKTYYHKSFEDPAKINGNNQDKIDAFRRIRDEINVWIEKIFKI